MSRSKTTYSSITVLKLIVFAVFSILLSACNEHHVNVTDKEIVETPEEINARAEEVIQGTLKDVMKNSQALGDSFRLYSPEMVQAIYDENSFKPIWSEKGVFTRDADSLFQMIGSSRQYGLFPEDYYYPKLTVLRNQLVSDTSSKSKKLDASLWAYSDMLFTSAFIQMVRDLKIGRLLPDSIIAKDTTLNPAYYQTCLKNYHEAGADSFARSLEPRHTRYRKLREALHYFLDTADMRSYTWVGTTDSLQLPGLVYRRIAEEDTSIHATDTPDSAELVRAIRHYQKLKGLKQDGKISSSLITKLNDTDTEKFICIAINLDRYKQLQPLPVQYIWVNLPSYYLQLCDSDTVVLKSRVVIGKPLTRTPIITSAISDMITYPQWTIPESIIKKEILPGLKKDTGYTIRKGYMLIDKDGNEVNPYTVKWSQYKNYIPYKVVQGSGDDNALGILKFNFPNKYSVYLHDTNQRYLFSRTKRALSHGCVRVQAWDKLAKFILRNDSTYSANAVPVDSLTTWLNTKQKRYVPVRKPIPLFIRYFTCDAENGVISFYEDVYGEDKRLRETEFARKQVL